MPEYWLRSEKSILFIYLFIYYLCLHGNSCCLFSIPVTESQYHQMSGFGRNLARSSSPIPLPRLRRNALIRSHRDVSRQILNVSREGDPTTPLGSPLQCSVTLTMKKFLLMCLWNLLCCSLHPLPLVLSLDVTEKSLAPFS